MVESENVKALPKALPESVVVRGTADVRMSPNDMRALKAETGRTLTALMEGDDDADRMQAVVWLRLRRDGYELSWEDAGTVAIEFQGEDTPDPTNGND